MDTFVEDFFGVVCEFILLGILVGVSLSTHGKREGEQRSRGLQGHLVDFPPTISKRPN